MEKGTLRSRQAHRATRRRLVTRVPAITVRETVSQRADSTCLMRQPLQLRCAILP